MKNGFKRVLSPALAAGVVCSTLCVPAQVFAADADGGLKDNFESYTATELVTGTGSTATGGTWTMVSAAYDNGGGSAVIQGGNGTIVTEDGTNKYLRLSGRGDSLWDIAAAEYTPDCSMLGPDVEMKIDFCSDGWDYKKGGLRFMVSSDGKSYYELYTSFGAVFKLRKVTNDTENWDRELTTEGTEQFVWYSLSLANDGDNLLWSINNHRTGGTESGKIPDTEMFELRGGAAKYQIIVAGDRHNNACFDNFSLNNIEPNAENYSTLNLVAADSFESYDVMADEKNTEVETVGTKWKSSSTYYGSRWYGYMKSQLVDNGSKMLRLAGYGNSYPHDTGCFNYIGDLSNVGSNVKMSVDMKAVGDYNWEHKGGIRFIAHNDDKNYYGLFSDGYNGGTYFEKVVDETVVDSIKVSDSQTADGSYYTYTMEKSGNDIKYSVINKTTKSVIASGTYTDATPFNPAKLNETYQLMVFNNGNFCFDNFRLSASEPEPAAPVSETANKVTESSDKHGVPAVGYKATFADFVGTVNKVSWTVTSTDTNDTAATASKPFETPVEITGASSLEFGLIISGTAEQLGKIDAVTVTIE